MPNQDRIRVGVREEALGVLESGARRGARGEYMGRVGGWRM